MSTFPQALTAIAPDHYPQLVEAPVTSQSRLHAALQFAAHMGDGSFFSSLPPVLMHDDARSTANKLYGGIRASPVPNAEYRAGAFDGVTRNARTYHGGAFFDLNGGSHLALIYSTNSWDNTAGSRALVAHVYEAPLAELEGQLYDDRIGVSPLERAWQPNGLSSTTHSLRFHVGAKLREGGLGTMPGFLLTGDYHLVRGALPWLHLRAPKTDYECERLTNALIAATVHDPSVGETAPLVDPVVYTEEADATRSIHTVFDRCADPGKWVVDCVTPAAAEATQAWAPFLERKNNILPDIEKCVQASRSRILLGVAAVLLKSARGSELPSVGVSDLIEVSEMGRAPPPHTIHTLSSMVRTCGVVSLTRIGGSAMNSFEKVAMATFAASDAVLAFRDVSSWKDQEPDRAESNALIGCKNMATRIKEPGAMLIIELDVVQAVTRMTLLNSAISQTIQCFDEAARLMTYPWVTVVVHRQPQTDGAGGWFTMNASLVRCDLLEVTAQVRLTFGLAPAAVPKAAASPESVEKLGKDLADRLEKLEKAVADMKTMRATAPAPKQPTAVVSTAAPTPAPSHTELSLRATVAQLQMLTGIKRGAEEMER